MVEKQVKLPVDKVNVGSVNIAVWENEGKDGKLFRSITISKSYKKDDKWVNTDSFYKSDLGDIVFACIKAFDKL